METAMNIPNPLKWHGGKYYLAQRIIALMPPHKHYVESCAGGLSVLLAKDPEGVSEVVNDLNGNVANFWDVLRDDTLFPEFSRLCEATQFSELLFNQASNFIERRFLMPDPDAAFWFFVRCRMSMSGRMKSFSPLSRNRTRRGMNEQASSWISAVDGLPEVHARMRRVVVLNRPAIDVIESQDGPETLHYLDPPYIHESRATTVEYGHFEMSNEDHFDLLAVANKCSGKVMISGYRSDLYDSNLAHWNRHDFELPNNSASGAIKRRMVECVWCNF